MFALLCYIGYILSTGNAFSWGWFFFWFFFEYLLYLALYILIILTMFAVECWKDKDKK